MFMGLLATHDPREISGVQRPEEGGTVSSNSSFRNGGSYVPYTLQCRCRSRHE